MIAHRLLAPPLQLVVTQLQCVLDHATQVRLDRQLVLGGGRHDPGAPDRPRRVDLVLVEQQAPGSLGGTGAGRPPVASRRRPGGRVACTDSTRLRAPLHTRTPARPPAPRCCGTGWCTPDPNRLASGLGGREASATGALSAYRAKGPVRYGSRPPRRACRAVERATCSSTTRSANSAGLTSRPSEDAGRPRSMA